MKSVHKILITLTAFILCISILAPRTGVAQSVTAATKKRISIGVGLYTDIWMNTPDGMKTRTINQGVQLFATYNVPFGKSIFSFAIGAGLSVHNLFWNYRFQGDSLNFQFVKVDETKISYKRSKLSMPNIEVPIEFRMKTRSKISVGIGFKAAYNIAAHAKWVGDDYLFNTTNQLRVSFKGIKNLENFSYGPTVRVGYKWFNVNAYYSMTSIFVKDKGPDIYPISIGFLLMPF